MKHPEPVYSNEHPMESASLATLESGLRKGLRIHAFRSGGGLRVVRLEDKGDTEKSLKGYGEHYTAEMALTYTAEDYEAGQRDYHDVYGEDKLHPHYLTGSSAANSRLDLWLLRGCTFDAYEAAGEVVFELHGYEDTQHPEGVDERARAGEVVRWSNRGYVYETQLSHFRGSAPGVSTSIVSSPEGKHSGADPWTYQIIKTGRAATLAQAIEAAFDAPSVEKAES